MLYLATAGPDQVLASGFIRERANRPQLVPFDVPPPPVGPFPRAVDFLRAVADGMDDFSTGATGGVGPWLEEVIRLYGDDCTLTIVDDSASGIVWELFQLEDGSRLGARARVVRWVSMVHRDRPVAWETEPVRIPARVAAYLHPDSHGVGASPMPALPHGVMPVGDPDDLCSALLDAAERGEPVGLVYVASRGALAHDPEEEAGLRTLDPPPVGTAPFRLRGVEGKLAPRPLLFVNTAYSARIPRTGPRPLGLVRAILAQVASGYIGTFGPVDTKPAASFAEQLLRIAAEGEVRPAEVLRSLRAQAQEVFENRRLPSDERRAALAAFLYVYFGNPEITLLRPEGRDG
jgi:hypothetical protein